ncbi:tetratricopeptide repeat protein [Fimbriiglobus ruber]|uniref:TPR repeat n=1 Tax=Fimbriiglobus ruber TaxID=1908690 RepID=A0A225E0V4_9BACT|nr:hypothetical protein [Fimbriiglobus ruber]OWK42315.1 TPR repeat precursor [Fimbriiglobus ruber]
MAQPTTQPGALELLREAMVAARTNDQPRTRQLLVDATRLDPNNETAWQWLAGVAATPLEATTAWERVLQLNPDHDKARAAIRPVRLKAGITAAKDKDVTLARRLLKAAVADDPGAEQGWLWLASVCETPQEGIAHLQRVLLINPANTTARKGIEYFQTKLKKAGGQQSGRMRMTGPASGIIRLADMSELTTTPMPAGRPGSPANCSSSTRAGPPASWSRW